MAFSSTNTDVGDTATQIFTGAAADEVLVQNLGPSVVYIGGSNAVTPDDGFQLEQYEKLRFDVALAAGDDLWAIRTQGSGPVRVLVRT